MFNKTFKNTKKLFGIFGDMFLFSLLLIIFLLPLLVSFILDPRLYRENPTDVAGVSDDELSSQSDFIIEEELKRSERVSILDSEKKKSLYEVKFKISGGDQFDETLKIGKVLNKGNRPARYILDLFADKEAIKGVSVQLEIDEVKHTLFDKNTFAEKHFVIEAQGQRELTIKILSDFAIRYDIELRVELRRII